MTERRLVPDRTFDSLPVFCRETHTHTHFFQSVVSSADLSTDRSTSPYNRSLVSRRPLHRHWPLSRFLGVSLGTIRSMTPTMHNHGETRLKPATLLHENLPKRESCAA